MYVWIWPSVTVSARIWRFAGKKSRDCPRQSTSQRFSSFINLPCYGVPQNYLHSDGPSALFLVKERLIAGYLKKERIKRGLFCLKRRALCWSIIPQASQANNWQTAQLKPGSNFPPSYQRHSRPYCLRCPSDMRTEVAGNRGHESLPPACLRSWLEFNFAGMPAVKTYDFLVPGGLTAWWSCIAGTTLQYPRLRRRCFGGIWEPGFT